MSIEKTAFTWDTGTVSGLWHHPDRPTAYLVLGHGAGGNMHTPGLIAFADILAAQGIGAVRFNFPYAEAKRRIPDPQSRLETCYRSVAIQVARRAPRIFLGGRSMGGRIASHVAASGFQAAGLVFLSYPLHPPGKPTQLRTAHLPKITVPMLFIQGSRDAFARSDLLTKTLMTLPLATLHVVDGADHALAVRGRSLADIVRELVDVTTDWIAGIHLGAV